MGCLGHSVEKAPVSVLFAELAGARSGAGRGHHRRGARGAGRPGPGRVVDRQRPARLSGWVNRAGWSCQLRGQRAGALFGLAELKAGDRVSVSDARGRDWTYRVYARQVYRKHQGLPAALFSTTGPARLVLITCGGPFNSVARSYQDNIVVCAATQP